MILQSLTCIFHFRNHYRVKLCCDKYRFRASDKPMIKPTLANQRATSSILIYNNANNNNCCCCQVDIAYHDLFSKISCIMPLDSELQCYPLLFLFYLIFCLFIAILCIFAIKYTLLYQFVIYFIVITALWELLFNYYRYYTTFNCIQTLQNHEATYKYYCSIFLRFSVYGIFFIILFSILFLYDYTQSNYLMIIWWILFLVIIGMHCLANIYLIQTFCNILLKQYKAIAGMFHIELYINS